MKKLVLFVTIALFCTQFKAQVGINNTNPNATLDITASDVANPSNTDGLLIPRMDEFPSTDPTAAQDGMLVFITGNGSETEGFYYWDNAITDWAAIEGSKNTLAQAYNQGGPGAGRIITANNGAVEISGGDGFRVASQNNTHLFFVQGNTDEIGINTTNPTAMIDVVSTGNGSRNTPVMEINTGSAEDGMHINLAGTYSGSSDNLDGYYVFDGSSATGTSARTKGFAARMSGSSTETGHDLRTFEAQITSTSNYVGDVMAYYSLNLSGNNGNQYGIINTISNSGTGTHYGAFSSLSGTGSGDKYGMYSVIANSAGGTHYGVYSNVANTTTGYAGYFIGRTSLGESNSNRYLMPAADGTNGQVMTTDGAGNVSFTTPTGDGDTQNTLDEAYDEGGAGAGRIITADNGGIEIQGTGGLRVVGSINAGDFIVHDGDINTSIAFNPDRVEIDAGGFNYFDIENSSSEITFNEDSNALDFRVESDGQTNMFFVDGSQNSVGIGEASPISPLQIGIQTSWDLAVANSGQDGIFMRGSGDNSGQNAIGSSIAFGAPANTRSFQRKAAIASIQTGGDEDNIGLGFFTHPSNINLSDMVEGMRLTHNRFLGINNTDPSANLDVVGTMQFVDGNESNGYVLASDANGNATWTDPATLVGADTDWTEVGSDIERQSGDVYIGDSNTTDNDLYVSDRIIDWDNNSYFLDLATENRISEITLDDGSAADPSIAFNGDTNSGFFQTEANAVSFGSSGTEYLKFSPKGQIEFLNTGNSVFVGSSAGNADDYTDNQNVGIGNFALADNTSGAANLAAGYLALRNNETGDSNVALGYGTLFDNTSGEFNIAIGRSSLANNTDGVRNIGLGNQALFDNVSGEDNIAIGHQSLADNTANRNIAIGFTAGNRITTGTSNVGIGYRAQAAHTVGDNNIAIGDASLDTMTSNSVNSNNIAIGVSSMSNLTEAESNIAIGTFALFGSSNGSPNFASRNVAVGAGAGQSNEGDGNIFIGYQAGQLAGVSDNKLFVDNSNTSNPLLYGEFDNNILRANGTLQVGNPSSGGFAFPTNTGTASQVLTTNGSGATTWADVPASVDNTTASNGLTESGDDVQLGGTLTQNTTINQSDFDMHFQLGSGSTADFQVIRGGGSNLITANNDGYILLGATATLSSPRLQVTGGATSGNYMADFYNPVLNNNASAVSIRIGTSVPHSGNYLGFFKDNTTLTGHINGNGLGGVNYSTVSDRRLKTKIIAIDNSLELINKIKPKIYEYKANPGIKEVGFIAQELQQFYPQAVSGDPNGDVTTEPMMIDYGRLTPLLTASIQELNKKVETLSEENEQLKKQLQQYQLLEARIIALEESNKEAPNRSITLEEK